MIIYQNDCKGFIEDTSKLKIADKIEELYIKTMGYKPKENEKRACITRFHSC